MRAAPETANPARTSWMHANLIGGLGDIAVVEGRTTEARAHFGEAATILEEILAVDPTHPRARSLLENLRTYLSAGPDDAHS